MSLWSWNSTFFKYLIKELSVFCGIYILRTCSKDRNAHLHKALSELYRCLSTELDYSSVRLLKLNNILDILRCKRLKIELICNVKVCTYCLRVIIYNDCLITFLLKRPCAVNRAVIKLDTLSDSYRTGTKYKNLLFRMCLNYFILALKA